MKRKASFRRDRCDGCGTARGGRVEVSLDGSDGSIRYCTGCNWLRERYGIDPGNHRQYELWEELDGRDEIAGRHEREVPDDREEREDRGDSDEWIAARELLDKMKGGV